MTLVGILRYLNFDLKSSAGTGDKGKEFLSIPGTLKLFKQSASKPFNFISISEEAVVDK